MRLNGVDEKGQHVDGVAGTIASLSETLYMEYGLVGFSTTDEDIKIALISDYLYYAGWATTTDQDKGQSVDVNGTTSISVNDWVVIEPLIRAHIELLQAQRMESSASLGAERHGLSVSEARMTYTEAKETMKREAFVEPPFTLDF